MKKVLIVMQLIVLLTVANAKELNIVKNGKSNYAIVVAPNSYQAAHFAAKDLQSYIYKATGVKLPIAKENEVNNRPTFRIGFEKINVPEGFSIKTNGDDIYISGNDTDGPALNNHWATGARTGTWYGVIDFLEKQLNVRWFFPGELGEYVPKTSNLIIDEKKLNYSDAPAMEKRRMNMAINNRHSKEQTKEIQLFLRRNRSGQANSWCGWHSWKHDFKSSDYFEKHPEWFALVGGRRFGINHLGHGVKMCTTNPEALDQYAKNLIKKVKKSSFKKPFMLTLSPNDGGFFCECANCTALDNGTREDGSKIMTDRIMTYANEVAKRVLKELPEQKFGLYAYSFYVEGDGKVKVHPSITVEEVNNDTGISYYSAKKRKEHLNNLKLWRANLSKLYAYLTPEGMGGLELPCSHYYNIVMVYDNLYKADVTGVTLNNGSSFGASALNNYFYLQFAWNNKQDKDKFYNQSLDMCYGKVAAPVLKAYFDDIEKRFDKFANAGFEENRSLGYIRRFPYGLDTLYIGLAEKYLPKLKDVLAKTKDKGQKARINIAIKNLEYCKTTTELYKLANMIVKNKTNNPKVAAKAVELANVREKQLNDMCSLPANVDIKRVLDAENTFRLPFDKNVYSYVLVSNARKIIDGPFKNINPNIDGNLDDEFWSDIKSQKIELKSTSGEKFEVNSDVKVAFTKKSLCISIYNNEPLMDKVKDSNIGDNAPVWNENCIDMFIDVIGDGSQGYYQLVFNSLGTYRAFKCNNDKSTKWNVKPIIKTQKGADFWSAEIEIPLEMLTKKKDIRGDIWGINFCRVRRTVLPSEYSAWSPTFGNFHNPNRFGKMIIK